MRGHLPRALRLGLPRGDPRAEAYPHAPGLRLEEAVRVTADAETTALDDATSHSGLVLQELFENLLGRPLRLVAEEDNSASIAAVTKGYSRRMCYLRRTQRISLSSLHEIFFFSGRRRSRSWRRTTAGA